MNVSAIFHWLCFLEMLLTQVTGVTWLYYEDWDSSYDEPIINHICVYLAKSSVTGFYVLVTLGISLVVIYAIKERRLGIKTFLSVSGIAYVIMGLAGAMLMGLSLPEYYAPPPRLQQFVSVGLLIALDVMLTVTTQRLHHMLSNQV